jgi:hypothetical protein
VKLAIDDDAGTPPIPTLVNTEIARRVASMRLPLVVRILRVGCLTQIGDPIVVTYTVAMIDLVVRPHAVEVQPGEAVCQTDLSVNGDAPIALTI